MASAPQLSSTTPFLPPLPLTPPPPEPPPLRGRRKRRFDDLLGEPCEESASPATPLPAVRPSAHTTCHLPLSAHGVSLTACHSPLSVTTLDVPHTTYHIPHTTYHIPHTCTIHCIPHATYHSIVLLLTSHHSLLNVCCLPLTPHPVGASSCLDAAPREGSSAHSARCRLVRACGV